MIAIGTGISVGTGISIGGGSAPAGIVYDGLVCMLDPGTYTSGSVLSDTSGSGNDAVITYDYSGAPVWQAGPPASFLYNQISDVFNASYMSVPNMLGSDMSVCAWINTTGAGIYYYHFQLMYIASAEQGGGAPDWGFGVNADGNIAFGNGYSDTTIAGGQVNTGVWTNVVATRELNTGLISLYINGQLSNADYGEAETVLDSNPEIWIGSGQDGPAYSFGGIMGIVMMYDRVLTDAEVMQNFLYQKSKYGV